MASGDSTEAVVDAFLSALRANSEVAAIVDDRVFRDAPPADAKYPMLVVGDVTRAPWDDDDGDGSELTIEIRAYANGMNGRPIGYRLAGGIAYTLDEAEDSIVVPGHTLVGVFVQDVRTTRDDVRTTGIVRVRVLTRAS